MLYEVICDKFKQKCVRFSPDLNTVLGDESGTNSIGKSTFLMIIDFVFGGEDYVKKSSDVQRNVGNHVIKFCFIFDGVPYFFSRETNHQKLVNICNNHYKPISQKHIKEYQAFLSKKYNIDLPYLSFRGVVGRYIRVYGRDNINEKYPLHYTPNEKAGAPTTSLLKLFNLYHNIAELESLIKERNNASIAFREAQKFSLIPNIGVKQYKTNIRQLRELYSQEDKLTATLDHHLLDMDSSLTDELINLKKELSLLRRQRSKVLAQLSSVQDNAQTNGFYLQQNLKPLLEFFPEANLKHFEEIEQFHSEISTVLHDEFEQEKKRLQSLLENADRSISQLEEKIKELTSSPNLSKAILEKHADIIKKIETLTQENLRYNQKSKIDNARKVAKEQASSMRTEQLNYLQSILNSQMSKINDYIYESKKRPPIISFHDLKYNFKTPDDTGTGTSYKGLIVFDISVLELTKLPILVHDSVILNQIADEAIERILQKYQSIGKQVFIALDKASSYTPKTTEILNKTAVLRLSDNGNELFGQSWNKKSID